MPECSYSPASDSQWAVRLRRPALGLDQLAIDQAFGDLDSVKRSAFAQVVRYDPDLQPVFDRCIFSDTADIGCILANAVIVSDVAAVLALVEDGGSPVRYAESCALRLRGAAAQTRY
jgi:hypothetical protein